jgi:hypothetical protein
MTEREDRLRAAAERVAEEVGREDVPDFIEILLNILCWQDAQDDEERCAQYDELVRKVIADIGKDREHTMVSGFSS